MHKGADNNHHRPSPTPWIMQNFIRHSIILMPSKGASAVALCWLTWFVYHVAIGQSFIVQGDEGHHVLRKGHHQQQQQHHRRLIEGKIVHHLPVRGLHADGTDVEYRCSVGDVIHTPKRYRLWGGLNGTRQPLRHPLNQSGVFDFTTHISDMKLKVLIVGNSLGEQLHAGIEEAMCYPVNMTETVVSPSDRKLWGKQSTCTTKYAGNPDGFWIKEPRIVSTPSGGLLAVIKDNTHMIDTKTKWNRKNSTIVSLLETLGNDDDSIHEIGANNNKTNEGKKLLDALLYQFQSGHVDLHDFDEHYLEEAIAAASDLFQATSVIFPTIGWMNNVDETRVDKWHEVNDRIRNFARLYSPTSKESTVKSVQFLDIAELSRSHIEANARILNIPSNETYTLRVESMWKSLVAQMCASLPFAEDPRGCLPGMVSLDGMHVCPETFHGRINAALVCLLDCRFNKGYYTNRLLTCSDGCNSKYMNLNPISFTLNAELNEEINLTL